MNKIIFSFLVLLDQVAYSQTSKNFGDFSAVKVYDRINVTLVKSSENKIQVKGDDPDVEIVSKNGELKMIFFINRYFFLKVLWNRCTFIDV